MDYWTLETTDLYTTPPVDESFSRVLETARLITWQQYEDVKSVVESIKLTFEPGSYFWGIDTDVIEVT
jgi:hypothetical protein